MPKEKTGQRLRYPQHSDSGGFSTLAELPCVNRSDGPFTVEGADAIRTGLDAIAKLPDEVKQRLLTERDSRGPFRDLADFRGRVQPGPEALTTLICCGALDFTDRNRPELLLQMDLQDQSIAADNWLFDSSEDLP